MNARGPELPVYFRPVATRKPVPAGKKPAPRQRPPPGKAAPSVDAKVGGEKKPSWWDVDEGRAPAQVHGRLLYKTHTPGVYRNQDGLLVDERGIRLSLAQVQEREEDHALSIIGGPVDSPAKLLKRIALDPTLPLAQRAAAAVSAAPYFDRRMPLALEGGGEDRPLRTETTVVLAKLGKLDAATRKQALALLEQLGLFSKPKENE